LVQVGHENPEAKMSEGKVAWLFPRGAATFLWAAASVVLEDGNTILTAYPKGHGRGPIVMKRSPDRGLTWSERLQVPENWATSQEVPTVFPVVDPNGMRRLIMFSGLYPIRMAVSEDEGDTWSPLEPIGDFGGIVAMSSVVALSKDGGLTWSQPEVVTEHPDADLCEPGAIRSPDGDTIALLLRENSRTHNSFVVFSTDEGETWSEPRELPAALTGDRHTAKYAPDGRLLVSFRDMAEGSPSW
jgi:Neuraminidase (sialidase)